MNPNKIEIKQILIMLTYIPNFEFKVRNIKVWKDDISHDYFLKTVDQIISGDIDVNCGIYPNSYTIELYVDKNISDFDIEKIKIACKNAIKNRINGKIKFLQNQLSLLN